MESYFFEVNFSRADLTGAIIHGSNLGYADLSEADLSGANLDWTDLRGANLEGAKLCGAHLWGVTFGEIRRSSVGMNLNAAVITHMTSLVRADFSRAIMFSATFNGIDLSGVKGLDTVEHYNASAIDLDTLILSSGHIPEAFLRGVGVPESLITYLPSLLSEPIQFYSCFISYSSNDQEFAERLYADLQNKGVRCWLASKDLKICAQIRIGIDESIRLHDKLLLVLSETSIKSQWVQQEVESALAKERERGNTVLFPIRLDDTVMQINKGWPAYLKNTRNIGDFKHWKDYDLYHKAFNKLLRDLKSEIEDNE